MKPKLGRLSNWGVRVVIAVLVVAAFVAGYVVKGPPAEESDIHRGAAQESPEREARQQWWTCSMHPQIRQPKPGRCPICLMDLIPVSAGGDDVGSRQISFSTAAIKLMEINTSVVERKFVTAEIRMSGKVEYDETRVKYITAWVPGRIDRLFVDYTGIKVDKGHHMVYLYSPQLMEDQQGLLEAVKSAEGVGEGGSELVRGSILRTLEAAREKLRLLGLTGEQISDIEKTGEVADHLTIYAPIGGVVIDKNATEQMYVETGTRIYTIADLSRLWVKLDAYESDMMWVRYGQAVEFRTEAYPGEVFKGRISFIDPVLNWKTRTVKLRVNVDNVDDKLKPEMFVRAVVRAKVAAGGRVMDEAMAGKWICPMHPDIVKDAAGSCDICGMDLETAESRGYVTVGSGSGEAPLVIPASAPLITGKRAVVYVEVEGAEKPTYEGREIVLGPRAGDYYIVESGLDEGEIVVTSGNFKIDSALQIQAKPSMMSASAKRSAAVSGGEDRAGGHKHEIIEVPEEFRERFGEVVEGYLALQKALASDDEGGAVKSVGRVLKLLSEIEASLLSAEARGVWDKSIGNITEVLESGGGAASIKQSREAFKTFTDELVVLAGRFGVSGPEPLYKFYCPMALDNKGANWLQKDKATRNPYFGASMLKCGKVVEVFGVEAK